MGIQAGSPGVVAPVVTAPGSVDQDIVSGAPSAVTVRPAWFSGVGDPENVPNERIGDCYLNSVTGDCYVLEENVGWVFIANVRGPQGIPGTGGGSFEFSQDVAAASWYITHGLGRYPEVTIVTIAGERVYADVSYPDENSVYIEFPTPIAGKAVCN